MSEKKMFKGTIFLFLLKWCIADGCPQAVVPLWNSLCCDEELSRLKASGRIGCLPQWGPQQRSGQVLYAKCCDAHNDYVTFILETYWLTDWVEKEFSLVKLKPEVMYSDVLYIQFECQMPGFFCDFFKFRIAGVRKYMWLVTYRCWAWLGKQSLINIEKLPFIVSRRHVVFG